MARMASSMTEPISSLWAASAITSQRAEGGDEKDVYLRISVFVLKIIIVILEFLVSFTELVRDVFEENESQNNMLIFSGIHIAPKDVCRCPNLLFKANAGCIVITHG
jgi:hypothetical protein